jgi:phosphate-selective porin OprO/OprP
LTDKCTPKGISRSNFPSTPVRQFTGGGAAFDSLAVDSAYRSVTFPLNKRGASASDRFTSLNSSGHRTRDPKVVKKGPKGYRANGDASWPAQALRFGALSAVIAYQFVATAGPEAASSPLTNSIAAPMPASEVGAELKIDPEHPQDDFQVRVLTNAPPEAGAATNKEEGFHWDVSWRGWDGLHLGISQTTHLKTPRELLGLKPLTNAPALHFDQLKMTANIGALIEVDAAAYKTSGNLDLPDAIGLRRARLIMDGGCILVLPVTYKIELGYIPHKFNLNQAWLESEHIDYIGYIKGGVFQPPMGLDLTTSSRDLTFMEPASVLQALAPANEAGIQIGQPVFHERGTWVLGIFGGGVGNTEYGNASQNYGNLIGRVSYLPIDHITPDRPEENQYLHLGLSANVQYSASSNVRYRSRPESYLASHVIDTGNIDASGSGEVAAETAYVKGPFSIQGEFIDSLVRENSGDLLDFYGFYANVSWYLTGESRPYDRVHGYFSRLIPRQNFDFGKGGAWGAFELGARTSYTDLDNGDIHGGKLSLLMGELNWYLNAHVRWMLNAGGGHVSGKHDGNLALFQTRVGIDF